MHPPLKYIVKMALIFMIFLCVSCGGSYNLEELSYSAEAETRATVMDQRAGVAWLDNPQATFEFDKEEISSESTSPSRKGLPSQINASQPHPTQELEDLVSRKIGNTAQEIQRLRVISETGRIDIEPTWPGAAPLQADSVLRNIGSVLIYSDEYHRTYKIPAGQLDHAMRLVGLMGKIKFEQIVAKDISLEMAGLERRLLQSKLLKSKYKDLLTKVNEGDKAKVLKLLEGVVQDLQKFTEQQKLLREKSEWANLEVYFNIETPRIKDQLPLALAWVSAIRPWGVYLKGNQEALELELVNSFTVVDVTEDDSWGSRLWRATQGQGASVRSWIDEDLPLADVHFWNRALQLTLAKRYEVVRCQIEGSSSHWNWCEFRVHPKDHRWSYLALKPRSEDSEATQIVQIDFPNQELKELFLKPWFESVKKEMGNE